MVMEKYRGSSSGNGELVVGQDFDSHLHGRLTLLDDARRSKEPDQQQTTPRIQEISSALSDKKMRFKRYYEPMVVAIDPVHSKKINYYDANEKQARLENGEKVKLKLARQFIQENGIPREAASMKIMSELQALKDCYQENALRPFSESDLAFTFLVDGCAVLQFMVGIVGDNEDLLLHHVNYDFISFAKRDIFLLENQLPYRLLQLWISLIPKDNWGLFNQNNWASGSEDEGYVIREFTLIMAPDKSRLEPAAEEQTCGHKEQQPLHLLYLLHRNLTFIPPSQRDIKVSDFIVSILIKLTYRCLFYYSPCKYYRQATYRSAEELKSAGIELNQSPTGSVTDVTFQQKIFRGTLSLPSITVNDSLISMFLNLVAYEMCPDLKSNFEVTSYICFLDGLIDHSEDARELRQTGILRNHFGSDEDMVNLFNLMAIDLVPNPAIYRRTKSKMYKQRKNTGKIRIWLAEMNERYFSSPWTFLGVCGAVYGLVLVFIQAWFAVKCYYHPKKEWVVGKPYRSSIYSGTSRRQCLYFCNKKISKITCNVAKVWDGCFILLLSLSLMLHFMSVEQTNVTMCVWFV